MKSTVLKYSIASSVFLLLSFIAVLLIQPSYKAVTKKLVSVRQQVLEQLEETFGLELRYDSMSPSILSSLYIRNLKVYDAETSGELLSLNKVHFRYDIVQVLSGNFDSAFRGLVLEGGSLAYDEVRNSAVRQKLISFIGEPSESSGDSFTLDFPFAVSLKNITISYSDKQIDGKVQLRKARVQLSGGSLTADMDATAVIESPAVPEMGRLVVSFGASGSSDTSFTHSSARVRFNSIENGDFSVSRLVFLLSWSDSIMTLNMVQNILPFQIGVVWDTAQDSLRVKMDTENFDPFKLVSSKKQNAVFESLRGSTLSGSYALTVNTSTGNLRYSADGSVSAGKKLVSDGLTAKFSASGDTSTVTVKKLEVASSWLEAGFEGSFDFKQLVPEGYLDLRKLVLPNGGSLQADVYVDPLDKGFMCFIPQLFLGEQIFTALQLTVVPSGSSVDFKFEVSDFSHPEMGTPGSVVVEGSFLQGKTPFVQASVSLESLYVDSVMRSLLFFLDETAGNSLKGAVDMLAPYAVSADVYVSTDFSSISVNMPRMVAVNTRKDREYMFVSLTGNENGGDLSIDDMLWMGQSLRGNFHVDIAPEFRDFFFTTDLLFNSFPYRLNGAFVPGRYISVNGDYGLDVAVNLQSGSGLNGTLFMSGFPVPIGSYIPAFSVDSEFSFASPEDWSVAIQRFEVEELSGAIPFAPRAALSGKLDKYGLFFDTITYTDRSSSLIGEGGVSWNYADGIPDSINGTLNVSSSLSGEAYTVALNLSNPEGNELSSAEFMKNIYISLEADVQRFPFSRFMKGQKDDDVLSGFVNCLGTLDSLYVTAGIDKGKMSLKTFPLNFSGQAALEDRQLSLNNIKVDYQNQYVKEFNGSFSLDSFTGELSAVYEGVFGGNVVSSPLRVSILPEFGYSAPLPSVVSEQFALSAAIPAAYNITVDIASLGLPGAKPFDPITLQLRRTPGRIDFSGGMKSAEGAGERAVFGYYLDSGDLSVELRDPLPVRLKADGSIVGTAMDVRVNDVYIDLSKFEKILSFPQISVYKGIIKGGLTLSGLVTDPEFGGTLNGTDVVIGVPDYVTEKIGPNTVTVQARKNGIFIDPVVLKTQKGSVLFDLALTFDRWMFEKLAINVKASPGTLVGARTVLPFVKIEGQASPDLHISVTPEQVAVTGSVFVQNGSAVISLQDSSAAPAVVQDSSFVMDALIDLTVTIGQHVELYFPSKEFPLIRALITPQTPLKVSFNSANNDFQFKGSLSLRGGEILYVRRSFYLREGKVDLNITPNSFDPVVTLRAEVREQDKDGNPVRITLSADNQPLSMLSFSLSQDNTQPVKLNTLKLSSDPPKSQDEIMSLIGQAAMADTTSVSSALISLSDVFTQNMLFRRFESAIRDLLKVDIFSLRTMFIQNVIMGVTQMNSGGKPLNPGNILDNSTVYIGKYFGPSLYADAMLHFSYDETKDSSVYPGGLVFQPEIGLEMMTPFFTLRWNLSPELKPENLKRLFVPDSSISLSWKFSF